MVERGQIEYSAARQARGLTKTIAQRRPDLAKKLGGHVAVQEKLLAKALYRKGRTREFEEARKDVRDTTSAPDAVLENYIENKDVSLSQARRQEATLAERRAVEDLTKRVANLDHELRDFQVDLTAAPNLRELRRALSSLAETATNLEVRVSDEMRAAGVLS